MMTLMDRPKHPAKFSDQILSEISGYIKPGWMILDPFAGTGKVAMLKKYEPTIHVTCNEMEKEWCFNEPLVDVWNVGDAEFMTWAGDNTYDAIITSPTYGNRMADHHNAKDGSRRHTYTHCLGHQLHDGNTGKMQWGDDYKKKHIRVYKECHRVLKRDGIFIINISDHIRKGIQVPVSRWHASILKKIGFILLERKAVETPRLRHGENHQARVKRENIFIFKKICDFFRCKTCEICGKEFYDPSTLPIHLLASHQMTLKDYKQLSGKRLE
jgi:SAM-dependent methyltransferase